MTEPPEREGDKSNDKKEDGDGSADKNKFIKGKIELLDFMKDMRTPKDWLKSLGDVSLSDSPQEQPTKVLETLDINGVAKYIRTKCKRLVTMVGAGISTAAGIPDFRSPGTGLYDNLQKYDLPTPQSIFDVEYLKENPEPFFMLAKELWPGLFKPTVCHYFIKLLQDKGILHRHYTQNIDALETLAGVSLDKLVEAHGSFRTSRCLNCQKQYEQQWMKEKVFSRTIPRCTEDGCDGIIKPDIVFFGDTLPQKFLDNVDKDLAECDMLIIMGTSLHVQPFASLTGRVPVNTPRLFINLEKSTGSTANPFLFLKVGGQLKFDDEDNYMDVFWKGSCDDGCKTLVDLLGWGKELKDLVRSGDAKFDKIRKSSTTNSKKPVAASRTKNITERTTSPAASRQNTSSKTKTSK